MGMFGTGTGTVPVPYSTVRRGGVLRIRERRATQTKIDSLRTYAEYRRYLYGPLLACCFLWEA